MENQYVEMLIVPIFIQKCITSPSPVKQYKLNAIELSLCEQRAEQNESLCANETFSSVEVCETHPLLK